MVALANISFFFFQAEDGIRDYKVTGVQTCALPISSVCPPNPRSYEGITPGMCQGSKRNSTAVAGPESVRAAASERAHRAEPNWTGLAAACKGRAGGRGCEGAGVAGGTLGGIGRNYGAGGAG